MINGFYPSKFMFIIREKSEDYYCRECLNIADINNNQLICSHCGIVEEYLGDPRD